MSFKCVEGGKEEADECSGWSLWTFARGRIKKGDLKCTSTFNRTD